MSWWARLLCVRLGWHRTGEIVSVHGPNVRARCPRCGYRGIIDSQGNLF